MTGQDAQVLPLIYHSQVVDQEAGEERERRSKKKKLLFPITE